MIRWRRFLTLLTAIAFTGANYVRAQTALSLKGDFWGTHDPSIAREGNSYYVFATGAAPGGGQFAIRCSTDLKEWRFCGHVFDSTPAWIHSASPGTRDLWAPDISYVRGEFRLYYAFSMFGRNTSGIALAVNKTLDAKRADYKWIDKGLVLRSTAKDDYNAIDPNFIMDAHGRSWLAFGSFWSGIKLRRLKEDGFVSDRDTRLYSLASREHKASDAAAREGVPANWQAIEAPFIVRHDGYYFLFVSWDLCCRGAKSTYRTMTGRAREITGPYLDRDGKPMLDGGGTELLKANAAWVGPGGESVLVGKRQQWIVFHAYDPETGKPALQISTLTWSGGWPHAVLGTRHEPAPGN